VCGAGKYPYVESFTTLGTVPKTIPTPTCTVNTGSLVTIAWTAVPDTYNATGGYEIDNYHVFWNTTGKNSWTYVGTTAGDTLTFSITNASTPGIPYNQFLNFYIIAENR